MPVGTGTLDGCHVARGFVLPDRQGGGCGTAIMDAFEGLASASYGSVSGAFEKSSFFFAVAAAMAHSKSAFSHSVHRYVTSYSSKRSLCVPVRTS